VAHLELVHDLTRVREGKNVTKKRSAFAFEFPSGVAVPPLLDALAAFVVPLDDWFSGHFQLCADQADAWFGEGCEGANELAIFGQEGDGSTYALWLHEGLSPDEAPVVYLNSENDGNKVVAGSLRDFLALLALDIEEIGLSVGSGSWAKAPIAARNKAREPAPHAGAYRKWLAKQKIAPIETAVEAARLTKPALAKHRGFEAWLAAANGEEPAAPPQVDAPPTGPSMLVLEIESTPETFQPALSRLVAGLAKRHPDLAVASLSRSRAVPYRDEVFEKDGRLPADFKSLSELRITYKDESNQQYALVIEPKRKHIHALLWMHDHPANSPACAEAGRIFRRITRRGGEGAGATRRRRVKRAIPARVPD
jgi:hypothetical protein